jgi:hypothetical protein
MGWIEQFNHKLRRAIAFIICIFQRILRKKRISYIERENKNNKVLKTSKQIKLKWLQQKVATIKIAYIKWI